MMRNAHGWDSSNLLARCVVNLVIPHQVRFVPYIPGHSRANQHNYAYFRTTMLHGVLSTDLFRAYLGLDKDRREV